MLFYYYDYANKYKSSYKREILEVRNVNVMWSEFLLFFSEQIWHNFSEL